MTKQQPENPQPLALNSKAKAARKLGVSFNTVQRWIRNGKLETVQIGDRTWVPVTCH